MTRSARYDTLIYIQQPVETANAAKELIKTWEPFADPWAKKTDTGGSETFHGAVIATMGTNFEIRYQPGITEKMRIFLNDKYYNIIGIQELGRMQGLLIKTERQDHGV